MSENTFNYRKRIVDILLKEKLEAMGAVLIEGPKACGNTTIKLGGDTLIDEGAANLNTLAEKIDTTKMKKPSFKMVLTAVGQYAYMRTDGVMVVPVGCLKD